MRPIPEKTQSPFEAHGAALAAWQLVETALYFVVHAALGTKEALSSTVFFHIRSPTAKARLTDALVAQSLSTEAYDKAWVPLRKQIYDLSEVRNNLAHFEMQGVVYKGQGLTDEITVRFELTEPFHDVKTHQRETVKTYNQQALESVTVEFRLLAMRLGAFVERNFGVHALPEELVRQGRERARHLSGKKQSPPKP